MSSGRSPIERRASSVRSQKSPLSHVPTMRQLLRDATKDPDALSSTIEINDYVQTVVNKIVVTGIVRFIGVTDFAKGIWVGVGKGKTLPSLSRCNLIIDKHLLFYQSCQCRRVRTTVLVSIEDTSPARIYTVSLRGILHAPKLPHHLHRFPKVQVAVLKELRVLLVQGHLRPLHRR